MRIVAITAIIIAASAGPSLAIENGGPVALAYSATVCRDLLDHARAMDLKADPVAWVRWNRETQADGRCWTIPAGTRAFAMSRMWQPSPVECIRVEGDLECGWGLSMVILSIKENEEHAEAEKRAAAATATKAPSITPRAVPVWIESGVAMRGAV